LSLECRFEQGGVEHVLTRVFYHRHACACEHTWYTTVHSTVFMLHVLSTQIDA
jgi:hypothetical protein